jgi:hypothetical protein
MNFREHFRSKLPGLYFSEGTWLEKIKEILLMPADIFMQVLDFIPRLRDLKNQNTPEDGAILEAAQRNLIKYFAEPIFFERILNSWETWTEAGSRYLINKVITMVGYTMDTTIYEYGVQEHITETQAAYWADYTNISENRGVAFDKFYWDGFIDSQYNYGIHIVDPTGIIYTNNTKIKELTHICRKFGPAHCLLYSIYFTDGAGNIVNTKDLL